MAIFMNFVMIVPKLVGSSPMSALDDNFCRVPTFRLVSTYGLVDGLRVLYVGASTKKRQAERPAARVSGRIAAKQETPQTANSAKAPSRKTSAAKPKTAVRKGKGGKSKSRSRTSTAGLLVALPPAWVGVSCR